MPRRVLGVALASTLVLAVAVAVAGPSTPAHAQEDLVEADPDVARARQRVEEAQQAAHRAAAVLDATNREQAAVREALDAHAARIAELHRQRAALADERRQLRDVMRERAAALYRAGGDGTGIASIADAGSALQGTRRQALGEAAAESNQRTAHELTVTREQLTAAQEELRVEEAALEVERGRLDATAAQLEAQQAELDRRVAEAGAALTQARAIGALRAAGEPIMGPSLLRADQLAAWVGAQGYRPRLETDLVSLAQIFIDEGADEGVRGDFAFAQSVIETGGFEAAPANNYAGIGWCDSCNTGNRFPDPREGVRAQVQLLRQYADAGVTAAQLHHPVSPYLYGADPVAAVRRYDSFYAKGFAPTWSDMGKGNWATDPNYAGKVIGVYRRVTAYAQGRGSG